MVTYTINKKETFINPYNFVSCDYDTTIRSPLQNDEQLHTGYLECRLMTRSPLAIPDATAGKESSIAKGHFMYPYFSYDGIVPVIPGSTLRGTIRNVYETVTDSCFSTLRDASIVTRREAVSKKTRSTESQDAFKPGLLRNVNGEWKLFSAKQYAVQIREKKEKNYYYVKDIEGWEKNAERVLAEPGGKQFKSGEFVYFTEIKGQKNPNYAGVVDRIYRDSLVNARKGFIRVGEFFSNKNNERIFVEDEDLKCPDIDAAMVGLEKTMQDYTDSGQNKNFNSSVEKRNAHRGYSWYERTKKQGTIPVWYKKIPGDLFENGIYLSMGSNGRYAYHHTINDLVRTKQPCKNRQKLCKACALFGTSQDEKLGSRVRITDAICTNWEERFALKKQTLRELGSPKASYLAFYLLRGINDTSDYDSEHACIRGRKFYWHSRYKTGEKKISESKRNATMDLVDIGAEFKFRVYYDRITQQQLKELVWAINFGENKLDGDLCHKTGHGKPLGLGSVKIVVENKLERTYNNNWNLTKCDELYDMEENPFEGKKSKAYKELMTIVNINTVIDQNVCYPYIVKPESENASQSGFRENDFVAHQWFKKYSLPLNDNSPDKQTNAIMPEILSQNLSFYPYDAKQGATGGSGKSGDSKPYYGNKGGGNNNRKGRKY